jgi:hypothetical protein
MMPFGAAAQQEPDGEALLTLSHPGIGQFYINAVYFGDVAFLPYQRFSALPRFPTSNQKISWVCRDFTPRKKILGKSIRLPDL